MMFHGDSASLEPLADENLALPKSLDEIWWRMLLASADPENYRF